VLRRALPASTPRGPDVCLACLAAARAESGQLARNLRLSEREQPDHNRLLCAAHLSDLAVLVGRDGIRPLLAWQAACLLAYLPRRRGLSPRWGVVPASWLPSARRGRRYLAGCAVCLQRDNAAALVLADVCVLLRTSRANPGRSAPLCVRHLLALRAVDPPAARVVVRGAVGRAEMLIGELGEAFRKGMWAHRDECRGQEMSAWRRAAAFLDGGVFCGCLPRG
jgi:hypothetical protein